VTDGSSVCNVDVESVECWCSDCFSWGPSFRPNNSELGFDKVRLLPRLSLDYPIFLVLGPAFMQQATSAERPS
jgi:hypothetical protein